MIIKKIKILLSIAVVFALFGGLHFASNYAFADDTTTEVEVGNATASISGTSLNNDENIVLVEDAARKVFVTTTVTDTNGCSTIVGVTSSLYRSGVADSCFTNDHDVGNYCYADVACTVDTSGSNNCDGGMDTSAEYICSFDMDYYADATQDGQSTYAGENWTAMFTAGDGIATTTDNTGITPVEVQTLTAVSVTGAFTYGESALSAGTNTGYYNSTTTIVNTGNEYLKSQVAGQAMAYDSNLILTSQQKFATSCFNYDDGGLALSGVATYLGVTWGKPYLTTTPVSKDVSWGIAVPAGQAPGTYTGTNSTTAQLGL